MNQKTKPGKMTARRLEKACYTLQDPNQDDLCQVQEVLKDKPKESQTNIYKKTHHVVRKSINMQELNLTFVGQHSGTSCTRPLFRLVCCGLLHAYCIARLFRVCDDWMGE